MRDYHVVVYVGYEGIDHILHVTNSIDEAVAKVCELRELICHNNTLPDAEHHLLPYPQGRLGEERRVCVKSAGMGSYECCCRQLGIENEGEAILY